MKQFKNIPGYEGNYQICNLGMVHSTPKDGKPIRFLKEEIIKANHTNYRRVSLSKHGKVKRFAVHRLVAQAFVPNPDNKPDVNHKDSNGENNHYSNLEWVTHSENMIHGYALGNTSTSLHKNGQTTKKLKEKATRERLTTLLEDRLVYIHPAENGRTYVDFVCKSCITVTKGRTDATTTNSGYCASCRRKNKHIIKED